MSSLGGCKLNVEVLGHDLRSYRDILFGSLLVITMVAFSEGLVGVFRRVRSLIERACVAGAGLGSATASG